MTPGYAVLRHTIPSVDNPTHGSEPEVAPPSEPAEEHGSSVAPWTERSGLDYTISAPPPVAEPQPEPAGRTSYLQIGIIAFLSAIAGALFTVGILSAAGYFDAEAPTAISAPETTVVATTVPPITIIAAESDSQMVEEVWAKVFPSV